MFEFLAPLAPWFRPYIGEISVALVACLLVVFGSDINAFVRRKLRNQFFLVKTLVFVLINAFGFGLIIIHATPYVSQWLRSLDAGSLVAFVIIAFIAIGLWAQKHRQI